jgi:beta-lactamase superfamily II metal-dependent hydrolase
MVKANSPNNVHEVALVDQHLEVSITDDCVAHLFNGSGKSAYSSLFLHLRFGSAQLLFTGDARCSYESKLVKKYGAPDVRADVLKVTHHGASDGTAANVLADIKPSIAIASTTAEKHHRLEQDTLDRLRDTTPGTQRQILETALVGDIIIETDGRPFDDGILYRVDSQAPGILAGPLGVTTTTDSQINRGQDNVSSCK